jgi:hypothetical protein
MANSNLVDCETGRSLGLKDLASVDPGLTMHVEKIGPVTHPPTDFDDLASGIGCGKRIALGARGAALLPPLKPLRFIEFC